jgi:hypothetical protein
MPRSSAPKTMEALVAQPNESSDDAVSCVGCLFRGILALLWAALLLGLVLGGFWFAVRIVRWMWDTSMF